MGIAGMVKLSDSIGGLADVYKGIRQKSSCLLSQNSTKFFDCDNN